MLLKPKSVIPKAMPTPALLPLDNYPCVVSITPSVNSSEKYEISPQACNLFEIVSLAVGRSVKRYYFKKSEVLVLGKVRGS